MGSAPAHASVRSIQATSPGYLSTATPPPPKLLQLHRSLLSIFDVPSPCWSRPLPVPPCTALSSSRPRRQLLFISWDRITTLPLPAGARGLGSSNLLAPGRGGSAHNLRQHGSCRPLPHLYLMSVARNLSSLQGLAPLLACTSGFHSMSRCSSTSSSWGEWLPGSRGRDSWGQTSSSRE